MSWLKFKSFFFFNIQYITNKFMLQSHTLNNEFYAQVLKHLRKCVYQKRPALWENKSWVLCCNMTVHQLDMQCTNSSLLVRICLTAKGVTVLSSHRTLQTWLLQTFLVFPKLEITLKGHCFQSFDEIQHNMQRSYTSS